jgi:hypothetical protein
LEKELSIEAPIDVKQACTTLDKYYIPIRYPDAWVEGAPEYYFTESDARDAINKALLIIEWVEETWRKLLRESRLERERALSTACKFIEYVDRKIKIVPRTTIWKLC